MSYDLILASIISQRITHDFLVITKIIINLEDWFSTVFLSPKLNLDFQKNAEINQLQIISSELKFPLFLCQLFSMIKDVSTDIQLATDNSNGKFLRYRYIGILHLWIYEMGGRSNQQEVIIVLAW